MNLSNTEKMYDHGDIIKKSFQIDKQSEGSGEKIKNGNQLWILLENLNSKKAAVKTAAAQDQLVVKKQKYIAGLEGQLEVKKSKVVDKLKEVEGER